MDIQKIETHAEIFGRRLAAIKASNRDVPWYPYGIMDNVGHIKKLLASAPPGNGLGGQDQPAILDIGAADGDLAFLMESMGASVDILENPPTNFNACRGIKFLSQSLNSNVRLITQDVDFHFSLPRDYNLALALGILYHLRNPFSFLIGLALRCERLILSTRIAQRMGPLEVKDQAVAYLLDRREANDDPTNYWIFSENGLTRLLRRSGWIVVHKFSEGCIQGSNPVDQNADERMFVYCKRIPNHADLLKHHDF